MTDREKAEEKIKAECSTLHDGDNQYSEPTIIVELDFDKLLLAAISREERLMKIAKLASNFLLSDILSRRWRTFVKRIKELAEGEK